MSKAQISIKLDSDLLDRIDQLAGDVGVTRTAVIEKALHNDLPEQEAFYKALENPVINAVHKRLTNPAVLRMLAKLTDGDLTDEDIAAIVEKAPRQREAAKTRKAKRSPKRTGKGSRK